MKNVMQKTITIAAITLLSTAAFAATSYRTADTTQHATFVSDAVSSQAEAKAIAEAYISDLQAKNGMQLSQGLPTPHSRINTRSLDVVGTDWAVVKTSDQYKAKVDVTYTYEYRSER
jgi:hypothetical protein